MESISSMRKKILVVEDESDLQDLLRFNLERDGFIVQIAASGERALELIRLDPPDLVLLDLMLPGVDGLTVCRTLRNEKNTAKVPVVMLTAKGEETDVVIGLELGADDYVTKPFSPRVLLARIKAVLRRYDEVPDDQANDAALRLDGLSIDPAKHQVKVLDCVVELTATEFKLLFQLASRPGRVFTRLQIIESLHGQLAAVTDRSVDVQVVSLRRKLGQLGDKLQTVRGVGYRFGE
jgi:DNA-binding response OmpR family regulator